MRKSFSLNRRTLLKSGGVAIALPWLEAMGTSTWGAEQASLFGFDVR